VPNGQEYPARHSTVAADNAYPAHSKPAVHGRHAPMVLACSVGLYVPGTQGTGCESPGHQYPTGHCTCLAIVLPVGQYHPASQVDPVADMPGEGQEVFAKHGVGAVAPSGQKVPAAQRVSNGVGDVLFPGQ